MGADSGQLDIITVARTNVSTVHAGFVACKRQYDAIGQLLSTQTGNPCHDGGWRVASHALRVAFAGGVVARFARMAFAGGE